MAKDSDLLIFVREHVKSVWALELLLLLRRDPERCWSQADLVTELRASQMVVGESLLSLDRAALILRDDQGCWRYQPAAPALEALCGRLQDAYRERPVAVIRMIAQPTALQSLADAFKFRGENE